MVSLPLFPLLDRPKELLRHSPKLITLSRQFSHKVLFFLLLAAGLIINVFNISGNTIKVYPTTQTIDGGSANAPVEIVTANGSEFVGTGTGTWRQVGSGGNNVEDFTINGTAKLLWPLNWVSLLRYLVLVHLSQMLLLLLRLSITSQLLVHQLRVWFYQPRCWSDSYCCEYYYV